MIVADFRFNSKSKNSENGAHYVKKCALVEKMEKAERKKEKEERRNENQRAPRFKQRLPH